MQLNLPKKASAHSAVRRVVAAAPQAQQPMAKAGTGRGNAFAARGASYEYLHISRTSAQAASAAATSGIVTDEMRQTEQRIVAHANLIPNHSTRERVKKEMMVGIVRARDGEDPLAGRPNCGGCSSARSGHKTFHFLCQSKARTKFKTKEEAICYTNVADALNKYVAERRNALGIVLPPKESTGLFAAWPATITSERALRCLNAPARVRAHLG